MTGKGGGDIDIMVISDKKISWKEKAQIKWHYMRKELIEDFSRLDRAVHILKYSLQQCKKIGVKADYSLEELDRFENLTSRFARTSDIYTQIVFSGANRENPACLAIQ